MRIVYSFGNNQRDYLYAREIEPYKKAVHEMLYAPTPNERRLKFKAVIREMSKLGLINYKNGDRTYDGENQERIGIITSSQSTENTPPILTHIQHMESSQRIGSVSTSGCRQLNEPNK